MTHLALDGTVTVSSNNARFEIIGAGRWIVMRFDQISDLRAAWKSTKTLRSKLRSGYTSGRLIPVRIELRGRTLAEIDPGESRRRSFTLLAARVFGLPLTRLRLSALLAR